MRRIPKSWGSSARLRPEGCFRDRGGGSARAYASQQGRLDPSAGQVVVVDETVIAQLGRKSGVESVAKQLDGAAVLDLDDGQDVGTAAVIEPEQGVGQMLDLPLDQLGVAAEPVLVLVMGVGVVSGRRRGSRRSRCSKRYDSRPGSGRRRKRSPRAGDAAGRPGGTGRGRDSRMSQTQATITSTSSTSGPISRASRSGRGPGSGGRGGMGGQPRVERAGSDGVLVVSRRR